MQSFSVRDAFAFRLATQQNDNAAKAQVFLGVFFGVLLRWVYTVAVEAIRSGGAWNFGNVSVILARLVVALIVTFFVFSGYWAKVIDQPAGMRFWNALAYGISIDALVGPWTG